MIPEVGTAALPSILRAAATALVVVALPAFLVANGVRSIALSESFYLEEFRKLGVGQVTHLSEEELARIARAFTDYFLSEPATLALRIPRPEGEVSLFNERELQHLADVQVLMHGVLRLWWVALGALALGALGVVGADPPTAVAMLLRALGIAGAVAVALVGILTLGALLDFASVFLRFHYLSFANDLWMLDPTRDRLIQLFPQRFFFDASLRIAGQALVVGGLLAGISFVGLRRLG